MINKNIAGFVGRLMLGIVMGVGIVSTMEGYRAKLINQQIQDSKIEQNKRYVKALNKNLENLVYTESTNNHDIDISRVNKYYYTNAYDIYERVNSKKVGSNGKNQAYLTVEKNKYKNKQSTNVTTSNILDKNLSGFASDFYDEKTVRLNQKLKSYQNLKEQANMMYKEVIKSKEFDWPCTLTSYKKDAWGRDFEYIREENYKVKIGFSLPWDTSKKTFIELLLPESQGQPLKIKKIMMDKYIAVLTDLGSFYFAGVNDYNQIGAKDYQNPNWIKILSGVKDFTVPDNSHPIKLLTNSDELYQSKYNDSSDDGVHKKIENVKYYIKAMDDDEFVVTKDNKVFVRGLNRHGELGLGHTSSVSEYTEIQGYDIEKISMEYGNGSYFITKDGDAYVTGRNNSCQLGLGHKNDVISWTFLRGNVKELYISYNHAVLITKDGEYYFVSSGDCVWHKFTHTSTAPIKYVDPNKNNFLYENGELYKINYTTKQLDFLSADVKDFTRDFIILNNGDVKVTGYNSYGEKGVGHTERLLSYEIMLKKNIRSLRGDNYTTLALDNDDVLWGVGRNLYGVLGVGNKDVTPNWVKVADDVKLFRFNGRSLFVLKNDHSVYAAGRNHRGQLGVGNNLEQLYLVKVLDHVKDVHFSKCAYGSCSWDGQSSYALMDNGDLYVTGENSGGNLGVSHLNDVNKWTESLLPKFEAKACN